MTISKEIINHMKEMKTNLKGYIQKIMDQKEKELMKIWKKYLIN